MLKMLINADGKRTCIWSFLLYHPAADVDANQNRCFSQLVCHHSAEEEVNEEQAAPNSALVRALAVR